MSFKEVNQKINFSELEQEILRYWREKKMFEQVQDLRKNGQPFVFFEGPPTANGKPGIHHVESRSFKDIIPRFQTMRGRKVDRKAGWDTHGLPVELQVEKKLGLKNKKEIEAFGIDKFNKECKEDVWAYKQDWERLTERMGFWLDLEHPYITYENSYIESVWHVLKHVSEQKDPMQRPMLYQGHKVVPYCTRCGTALSSHEVAQGYKPTTDTSVYVKFRISNSEFLNKNKLKNDEVYLLAWTTTPWTLPGNVALAVRNDVEYVLAHGQADEQYIVAKELVDDIISKGIELVPTHTSFRGSELVGLEYEPLFPGVITGNDAAYKVYDADFVTTEDGTGIVHTAVMYGEDDYNLGTDVGLPKEHTVGEDGRFVDKVGQPLAGKYVKAAETEKLILEHLRDHKLLLQTLPYTHEYPYCWRCDSPLLYYARTSWFIRMSELRDELVKRNNAINWEPDSIKAGRMGEWLANAKDWAISRERYWGTPLPFWKCENEHLTVVGSIDELKKLGANVPNDLHRPFIDDVTFDCPQCKSESKRVPEVADVWLDSGSMPFAQWGYPQATGSNEQLNTHYPADFICEAIDQTRGWFYTLLAVATLMGAEAPYKNVICLGHVLDQSGKKMSKSKGNVVDPFTVIDAYGADAVRFYFYAINPPGEPKLFTEKDLQTTQRKVIMLWWNIYSFFVTYANENAWTESNSELHFDEKSVYTFLDKWIWSRLQQVNETVTKSLESYDVLTGARALEQFIDDLSTWYVRRSRDRFSANHTESDRNQALATLYAVLVQLAQLMAPLTPFVAEETHMNLTGKSVHLSDWPKAQDYDKDILEIMEHVRQTASRGLELRMRAGIKVRQMLPNFLYRPHPKETDFAPAAFILKEELNIAEIGWRAQNTPFFANDPSQFWLQASQGAEEVWLDTEITEAMKEQGILRELSRSIQGLRKEKGFSVSDRVVVNWHSTDQDLATYMQKEDFALQLTNSTRSELKKLDQQQPEMQQLDLNGHIIWVNLD